MMEISKSIWKEIEDILKKYKIPCTAHCTTRDLDLSIKSIPVEVIDKHIQINLTIPDFYDIGR
jgi:hypothetical protein